MEIGVLQIKGWDRDNPELEKLDINLADQVEIHEIMKALSQFFWRRGGNMEG
jgi:hypothetical protein